MSMNLGRTVFSQLISHLPDREFRRCGARYHGDRRPRGVSCWDQFLCMAFAQLTYRESLRDIKACTQGRPFQELLQYFAMERFLYRLARIAILGSARSEGALLLTACLSFPANTASPCLRFFEPLCL
jgi:hypothetical protein